MNLSLWGMFLAPMGTSLCGKLHSQHRDTAPVFLPGESQGRGSLARYSLASARLEVASRAHTALARYVGGRAPMIVHFNKDRFFGKVEYFLL